MTFTCMNCMLNGLCSKMNDLSILTLRRLKKLFSVESWRKSNILWMQQIFNIVQEIKNTKHNLTWRSHYHRLYRKTLQYHSMI